MTPTLYRLLLRCCPREFRDQFGDELLATAEAASAAQRPSARLRAFVDAVRTVIGLRRDVRRERRVLTGGLVRQMAADLRVSVRGLRRAPMFSLAAMMTLALGIAAFAVVFAIVDALMLRPLPFGDRGPRLVTVHSTHPSQARDWNNSELSYSDILDLRARATSLEALEGVIDRNFSVAGTDDAARVLGASVTPGLFTMLGVAPAQGRLFRADEAALPGLESVAIISHTLWQHTLGGDPGVIGSAVLLNARPVTVIGVMPEGFGFPEQHQVWLPYAGDPVASRGNRALIAYGLLREGVSPSYAAGDLDRVAATLAREFPETHRAWGLHVLTLREFQVGGPEGTNTMLAAVALLLLVACANVGGLLIARGASRTQELATRAALGAGRLRLASLVMSEAVVIAAAGGVAGVLLSAWALPAILATVPERPAYWVQPALDARVLLLVLAVTMLVALLAGALPAVRLSRIDLSSMGSQTRVAGGTARHQHTQRSLVVAQVAVSLVLLAGATLLAASAVALQRADAGFDPAPVLSGRFYIAGDAYDAIDARAGVVTRVADAVAAIPGVTHAAVTSAIPADDGGPTLLVAALGRAGTPLGAMAFSATAGFWTTLGLQLREGRTFTAQEQGDPASDVVIVNGRLADRLWPGQPALDQVLALVNARGDVTATLRVVGVAPDLTYEEFGEVSPQAELNLYVPYARQGSRTMAILARASAPPSTLADSLRRVVRGVDPSFAAFDVMSLSERRRVTTWSERFLAATFTVLAGVTLLLACLGAYASMAYAVAQRRREVGVRLALGAHVSDVVGLFVRAGTRLAVVGLLIGAVPAAAAARALASGGLLFDVSPADARLWVGLPVVLLTAVLVATLQPALTAGRVDPADVLRD